MTTLGIAGFWIRVRAIPPTIAGWWRDKFGRIHEWRVELIAEWKSFLMRAWSVRFIVGSQLLAFAYAVWPAFQDVVSLGWFVAVHGLLTICTIVAQLMPQKGMKLVVDNGGTE